MAWVALQSLESIQRQYEAKKETIPSLWPAYDRNQYGPFIIAAMLGNTGFVGLGILPTILEPSAFSWAVFFSLTQNIIGTYFIGVDRKSVV